MSLKKRFIIGLAFIALIVIVRVFRLHTYLNIAFIKQHLTIFESFVQQHYLSSVLTFLLFYVCIVTLTIPISPLLNLLAGALFSFIPAVLYCVLGATLGATTAFFLVRYAFGTFVQKRYGDRLEQFNREFKARGSSYLLFLQLLPVTPFAAIIAISGLSELSWWTFVWTTAVGITPGTIIYVFAGRELAYISKPADILSLPVILAFIALACIAFIPVIMRFLRRRTTRK